MTTHADGQVIMRVKLTAGQVAAIEAACVAFGVNPDNAVQAIRAWAHKRDTNARRYRVTQPNAPRLTPEERHQKRVEAGRRLQASLTPEIRAKQRANLRAYQERVRAALALVDGSVTV